MIFDLSTWKFELLRIAGKLKKFQKQQRWPEASVMNIEKNIFIAFYIIRKLNDACKLSGKILSEHYELLAYKKLDRSRVDLMNWHKIDEQFNLKKPAIQFRKIDFIWNLIIYSYVFVPSFNNGFKSIFITSDKFRNEILFEISLIEILKMIENIANDEVIFVKMNRNVEGDWEINDSNKIKNPHCRA